MKKPHLWEVGHAYYCSEGNYFRTPDSTTRTVWEFKSWADFIAEMADQRKGYHSTSIVEVCRADESAVIEFLQPRLEYLLQLWLPLASLSSGAA